MIPCRTRETLNNTTSRAGNVMRDNWESTYTALMYGQISSKKRWSKSPILIKKVHPQVESYGRRLCRDGRAFRIVFFGRRLLGFLDGLNCAISFILDFLRLCP